MLNPEAHHMLVILVRVHFMWYAPTYKFYIANTWLLFTLKNTVIMYNLGFTNPPRNLTCQVVDQSSNISQSRVILSWERPTLQAYTVGSDGFAKPPEGGSYVIVYEANGANHSVTVDAKSTTTLIDLTRDGQYTFRVYFDHNNELFPKTAISKCENNTLIRRSKIS